mmetsp:Transcript_10559/g.32925  ORF Transcript_10559/g.32925 Transcript_10559/m.32925 type:complete len:215 (+) Transcript_10559:1280-1924(+)
MLGEPRTLKSASSAPASTMASVSTLLPEAAFVRAHAASSCTAGEASVKRATNGLRPPASMRAWMGGRSSVESSFRSSPRACKARPGSASAAVLPMAATSCATLAALAGSTAAPRDGTFSPANAGPAALAAPAGLRLCTACCASSSGPRARRRKGRATPFRLLCSTSAEAAPTASAAGDLCMPRIIFWQGGRSQGPDVSWRAYHSAMPPTYAANN